MNSYTRILAVCLLVISCGAWGSDYASVSSYIGEAEYAALTEDEQALIQRSVAAMGGEQPLPMICSAEGTPSALQQAVENIVMRDLNSRYNSLGDFLRWTETVTDGAGLTLGDPVTLTWSIVPDGTDLGPAQVVGETDNGPSDMIGAFNAMFGSQSIWEPLIQSVFDQWSRVTGITFVKVSDDGAVFPSSPGVLGIRGEIRIGGRSMDGTFGKVGYSNFPMVGDIVIDTDGGAFLSPTFKSYIAFRNTLSHEVGHSIGFSHVCPIDGTKLMEPDIPQTIDHSSLDDIAHGNRKYGDPAEKGGGNDNAGDATNLGSPAPGKEFYGLWPDANIQALSLDSVDDEDFFSVDLTNGQHISFHVRPRGSTFPYGDGGATCGAATIGTLNSLAVIDLEFELIDTDQSTVLAGGDGMPAGFDESIFDFTAPAAGTYYLRVYTNDAALVSGVDNQVQLYSLRTESPGRGVPGAPMATWMLVMLAATLVALGGGVSWSVVRRAG